jgi:16S rRNA (cytidine1402-2'-O)-methyltransferase
VTGVGSDVDSGSGSRGTLYVVGTPIGNLGDLSSRAVEVLAASALIACEDTRRSRVLLSRRGIAAPLLSYHKFNEKRRLPEILDALARGGRVALISDGGTPGVSDPGAQLVRAARAAGHAVVPVPGPSAITALLSVGGLEPGPFTFIGFLPHRTGERRRALATLRAELRPLLFFESPRRLVAMLRDALEILGNRKAFLGREMTKLHEEFVAGRVGDLLAAFEGREVKGEIALLIAAPEAETPAAPAEPGKPQDARPGASVRRLVEGGMERKEAIRRVARETGLSRRDVYRAVVREREEEE